MGAADSPFVPEEVHLEELAAVTASFGEAFEQTVVKGLAAAGAELNTVYHSTSLGETVSEAFYGARHRLAKNVELIASVPRGISCGEAQMFLVEHLKSLNDANHQILWYLFYHIALQHFMGPSFVDLELRFKEKYPPASEEYCLQSSFSSIPRYPRIQFHGELGFHHFSTIASLLEKLQLEKGNGNHTALGASPRMIEVGIDTANASMYWLQSNPDLQWIGVDPYDDDHGGNMAQWLPEERYAFAMTLLLRYSKRATLMRAYSTEAAAWIQDKSIDLVFIDGLHTYEGVRSDLHTWISKVRPGGIIAGHDYDPHLPGVPAAVHEFLLQNPPLDDILHILPEYTFFFFVP